MRSNRTCSLSLIRAAAGSCFILLLAACGERSDDPPGAAGSELPATEHQPVARRDVTAELVPLVEDSPMGGSIYIDGTGDQPIISVSLRGAVEGVHQGHVHTGTCASPGRAVAPLEPIDTNANGNGESITTVELPLQTLTDGAHIVVYHEADGAPGAPIICGQIPALS
jgi:hypothetical protein